MAIRKIGQIFVDMGFISDEQLEMLLEDQQQNPGQLLGAVAQEMGLVTEEQVAQALAEQMGMQVVRLGETPIQPEILDQVTEAMAQMYRVIPVLFDKEAGVLTMATCDPQNLSIQDELRNWLGFEIRIVVATERDIKKSLDRYYAVASETVETIVGQLSRDSELQAAAEALSGDGPKIGRAHV